MKNEDFFNLSSDIMCVINENNNIEHANKSWERILGYKSKEIESINFTKLIHPDDVDKTLKDIETLKNKGEIANSINRYKKSNGEFCHLEWRATYHNNKIYATAREVSEKIRIKNKLKSSEENFKNFFETMDSMAFVGDEKGNIIYVNKKVEERLNYNKEELVGKHLLELHQKEKRNEAEKNLSTLLINKKGKCLLPLVTKEGNLVPVDTRIWLGEWNHKKCIYATSKDLTIEQENLQKFNKIFKNNPASIAINDIETGEFIEVNDNLLKLFGYKKEEVVGKTIRDLGTIIDDEKNSYIEKEIQENGRVENVEVKYRKKNGEEGYGLIFGETIETGSKKFILNIMVDITKEIKTAQALEYKNEFLYILMEISFRFINYSYNESENFIDDSLATIGNFVEADRVYIFDYDFKNETTSNTFEWCRKGIEPQIEYLQDIPIDIIYSWVRRHKKGKIIRIPEVSSYKSEDKVKEILESQNIKSVLSVPMFDNGECIGFVGFDSVINYKKYKHNEIHLLKLFAQALVDIRKKEKKEKKLINTIEEKSILMREIHHRVKNNLQLVSSLLYLQSSYIQDPKVKKVLKDTENRVKSMAILHEKIYRTKELNNLNFKDYIEEIIKELLISYKIDKKIKLDADIKDIDLNIDKAINCGLIVNELITNSIQHAFNDVEKGKIKIKILQEADKVFINISDDGSGFKEDYEDVKTKSLGLQIVESLVKQLKGTIKKENSHGTKFTIQFKN